MQSRNPRRRPATAALGLLATAAAWFVAPVDAQSLDPTFWDAGLFEPAFVVADAVVHEDGHLVAVGVHQGLAYAWRIDDQGGTGEPFGNLLPLALAVEPGGKVLIAARHPSQARLLLARLDRELELDPGFGEEGIVELAASTDATDIWTARIVSGPDGAVYVASLVESELGRRLVVDRVLGDGSNAVGDGFPRTFSGSWWWGRLALAARPDGRLLVAGTVGVGPSGTMSDWRLYRLLPHGGLDASFGSQGRVDLSLEDVDSLGDLAIAADGGVYVTGLSNPAMASSWLAVVARLTPDGTLDPSFGFAGRTTFPFAGVPLPDPPRLAVVPGAPEWLVVTAGNGDGALEEPTSVVARAFTNLGASASWFAGGGTLELALPPTPPGHTPAIAYVTPRLQGELLDRLALVARSVYVGPPAGPTDPWPTVERSRILRLDLR